MRVCSPISQCKCLISSSTCGMLDWLNRPTSTRKTPIYLLYLSFSFKLGKECSSRYESASFCVVLQKAFVSHPNTRSRGEAGVMRSGAEQRMTCLRAGRAGIHLPWALQGIWVWEAKGQPSSAKGFPFLVLASFSPCSTPCCPSSSLHSLWKVNESFNWVMNLGKKPPCFFAVFCCSLNLMTAWPAQLSSAECQGYLERINQSRWPGSGRE